VGWERGGRLGTRPTRDIAPATLPNTTCAAARGPAHIHIGCIIGHKYNVYKVPESGIHGDVFHHRSLCLTEADELVLSFAESNEFILALLRLFHILDCRTAFAKADELVLAFTESDELVLLLLHRFARLLL